VQLAQFGADEQAGSAQSTSPLPLSSTPLLQISGTADGGVDSVAVTAPWCCGVND